MVGSRSLGSQLQAALVVMALCIAMVVGIVSPAAAATVVVNQNHEHGWHQQRVVDPAGCGGDSSESTGDQNFEPGPQGAPGQEDEEPPDPAAPDSDSPNGGPPGPSAGSLEFSIGPNGASIERFRNVDYHGVSLNAIEEMTYWTYEDPGTNGGLPTLEGYVPAVYIRLVVDKGNGDLDQLVFEPAYQDDQHDVDRGAWQKWIADDTGTDGPEGVWWRAGLGDQAQVVANMKSLDEWAPPGSDWRIVNVDGYGGLILGAGCGEPSPWSDFRGNTDHFTIDLAGPEEAITYDFEPGSPTDPTVVDCEPETAENPTRTNHEITCTATNSEGVPVRNTEIDIEAVGANDPDDGDSKESPDFSCVTEPQDPRDDTDVSCTIVHGPAGEPPTSTNESGVTEYTAWVDIDKDNTSVEADLKEGVDETEPSQEGDDREPDGTDVVEKTWLARTAEEGGVDAEPEFDRNELGENHSIQATVYDQFGDELAGSTTVNFEFFSGSPSDTDGNTPSSPDKTCTTVNSARCSVSYSQTQTTGTDLICVFTNEAPSMSASTCGGEGQNEQDDDPSTADAPQPADDDQDVVSKTWVAPTAKRIDCDPENVTAPTGSAHRIVCSAMSTDGITIPGTNIDVEATGANDPDGSDSPGSPDFTCTTDSTGSCSIAHGPSGTGSSSSVGTTTYRAWIDRDGNSRSEADGAEGRDEATAPGGAEPDNTDVVQATWQLSPLECEPETSSGPVGTQHTIRCSAATGTRIDVEITGANDPDDSDSPTTPDLTCTTTDGRCSMPHGSSGTNTETGSTIYRAWIDNDGLDSTNESDTAEGRDEAATPGTTPEADNTDVVERIWTQDPITQCNDGADNDGDGRVDHPEDPGCESAADGDETDPRETCPGFRNDPRNQIVGTPGRDRLVGTSGNDIICGLGRDDRLVGGRGRDLIIGGGGNDLMRGGAGADVIRGGRGGDVLSGGGGRDRLRGGPGNDFLDGGRHRDRCSGGRGRDRLTRCHARSAPDF